MQKRLDLEQIDASIRAMETLLARHHDTRRADHGEIVPVIERAIEILRQMRKLVEADTRRRAI